MQKSTRYHIADGDSKPVVRTVELVVKREPVETQAQPQNDRQQAKTQNDNPTEGKSRWIRPALRKALLPSS